MKISHSYISCSFISYSTNINYETAALQQEKAN